MNNRILFGMIAVSVVMIFVAAATDVFWIGRAAGAFPPSIDIPERIYTAFGLPDLVLSLFLYAGAAGLLKRKSWGVYASMAGLGMWLFDSLLVLGITGTDRIDIVGPSLLFSLFAIGFLFLYSDAYISDS